MKIINDLDWRGLKFPILSGLKITQNPSESRVFIQGRLFDMIEIRYLLSKLLTKSRKPSNQSIGSPKNMAINLEILLFGNKMVASFQKGVISY